MKHLDRIRYSVECVLAYTTAFAFVLTILVPDWLEELTGLQPDGGSGGTESGFALSLLVCTIAFFALAHRNRRARRATR